MKRIIETSIKLTSEPEAFSDYFFIASYEAVSITSL